MRNADTRHIAIGHNTYSWDRQLHSKLSSGFGTRRLCCRSSEPLHVQIEVTRESYLRSTFQNVVYAQIKTSDLRADISRQQGGILQGHSADAPLT